MSHLSTWNNQELVQEALDEILKVHERYAKFSEMTEEEAKTQIELTFPRFHDPVRNR